VPDPLEKLKALYEEWGRGEFSRGDLFDQEIITRTIGLVDQRSEARGVDQMVPEMRKWLSAWEYPFLIEPEEFIESGDRILVLVRWRGRGKGSGVEMEAEGAHIWTFREGLAVGWDIYRDRDEARAAMGQPG
jgi:ketosteroid isomerase-like protein